MDNVVPNVVPCGTALDDMDVFWSNDPEVNHVHARTHDWGLG